MCTLDNFMVLGDSPGEQDASYFPITSPWLILSDRILCLMDHWPALPRTSHNLIDTGGLFGKQSPGTRWPEIRHLWKQSPGFYSLFSPFSPCAAPVPSTTQGTEIEHRRHRGLFTSSFSIFAESVPAGIIVPTV